MSLYNMHYKHFYYFQSSTLRFFWPSNSDLYLKYFPGYFAIKNNYNKMFSKVSIYQKYLYFYCVLVRYVFFTKKYLL